MPVDADLIARCLAPIPGDAPAGAELRYDPRLDEIKEARREESLPGSDRKVADWTLVVSATAGLLQKETKDLQLAAWLTEALLRRSGFAGLCTGLSILQGLLEQFWDGVYPLPEDGDLELRVAPIEWVAGRLSLPVRLTPVLGSFSCADIQAAQGVPTESEAAEDREKAQTRERLIEEGRSTPEELDAVRSGLNKVVLRATLADVNACLAIIDTLEKSCDARFSDLAPSFRPLRDALDEPRRTLQGLITVKLEEDPDPVEMEAVVEETSGDVAPEEGAALTADPVNDADAARRVGSVAKWLRQKQNTNPAPYLLLRGFRWGELRAHAPRVEPRLLEAAPTAMRTRLKALMLDGKWAELLELSETIMATPAGRGWLDLQRYAITACANQGEAFVPVADAIRSELRALLKALPELPRMTLMDDTPAANDETREWIESEVLDEEADAAPNVSDDSLPSDGSELVDEALDEDAASAGAGGFARRAHPARKVERDVFAQAMAEVAQRRPQRAIELLTAELVRERSPRGRFLRQTQIAYVMVEAGLDSVARPILQRLVETIEERSLEQWEAPSLVAQPMALMYKVLYRANPESEEAEELYLKVCRLDPIQALALRGS